MEEQFNTVDAVQESVVEAHEQETVEQIDNVVEQSEQPEVAEPEKPQQSPEENAKYAKIRRDAEAKAKAQAQDAVIAEMFGESHGIYTKAQYDAAIKAEKEAARRAEMESQGIDPDYVSKLIAEAPEVKQAREILSKKQQEEQEAQQALQFFEYFEEANGRPFDAKKDILPPEVWEMKAQGIPLKQAYAAVEAKQLREELRQLREVKQAEETNRQNAISTPGGLDGTTNPDTGFISFDVFEANKSNQNWMKKNLEKIIASRQSW